MEKLKGSNSPIRKMKTNLNLCLPRLQKFHNSTNNNSSSSNNNKTSKPLTPMTLLERFREAVLRLIMLSALSKAAVVTSTTACNTTNSLFSSSSTKSHVSRSSCYYYNPAHDPHHSEAVADCIEFIKNKALTEDELVESADDDDDQCRESNASTPSNNNTSNIPVPVML